MRRLSLPNVPVMVCTEFPTGDSTGQAPIQRIDGVAVLDCGDYAVPRSIYYTAVTARQRMTPRHREVRLRRPITRNRCECAIRVINDKHAHLPPPKQSWSFPPKQSSFSPKQSSFHLFPQPIPPKSTSPRIIRHPSIHPAYLLHDIRTRSPSFVLQILRGRRNRQLSP